MDKDTGNQHKERLQQRSTDVTSPTKGDRSQPSSASDISPAKGLIGFSLMGSLMTIIFMWVINSLTTPDNIWFIIPSLFLLLWPATLIFAYRNQYRAFSLFGSVLLIALLITVNLMYSPHTLWFVYAIYPIIWWPIVMYAGRRAATVGFAMIASLLTIAYYSALNLWWSPGFPWAIFPAYVVLWCPMTLYFVRRQQYFALSTAGSLLTIIFFSVVNLVSSPQTIWAIYPIFGVLWWPLSMYYFYYLRRRGYRG